MKKWIIATYLFYQSKDQFNYWSKWVNMKRWKVSLFRGRPRRRSRCCQCAIMKSEYVKFVMYKKTMLIFLCNTKMNFFFDTWLYFWCYVIIKIYHHDITVLKAENQNLVLQKKTFCLKKSWCRTKTKVVSTKTS